MTLNGIWYCFALILLMPSTHPRAYWNWKHYPGIRGNVTKGLDGPISWLVPCSCSFLSPIIVWYLLEARYRLTWKWLWVQVVCALVGSLGAVYTGIVLANLVLALFALIAIESGSQSLGRAYAGLLALSLLLDIVWFILFTDEIRWVLICLCFSCRISIAPTNSSSFGGLNSEW